MVTLMLLRQMPQQHQRYHNGVLRNGHAVGVAVAQKAVWVGEKAFIPAIGVYPGGGGAVPFQCGGRGAEQVRGGGVENLAVLHAVAGGVKLVLCEEIRRHASRLCGGGDLRLVCRGQKALENADITAHK